MTNGAIGEHDGHPPPANGTIPRVIDYRPEPETRDEFEDTARGTNHEWVNRSGKPRRIALVLVDGGFG